MTQTAKDYLDLLCRQTPDPAYWDWEATLEQCYLHCLDPGAAIVDIGAHTGRHARVFRDRIQASRLWLVEPLPDEFAELGRQFASSPQTRLVNKALSSAPGHARFTVNVAAKEESGLRRRHYNDEAGARVVEIDVEISTLDLLLEEHGAERLDFIKIDVEGAELDVLAGSEASVRRFRPLISVEFGAPGYSVYERRPEELYTLAERWNYTLCDLLGHPVEDPEEWLKVVDAYYWDYLMVPAEKLAALQTRLGEIAGPVPVAARLSASGKEGQAVSGLAPGSLPQRLHLCDLAKHTGDALCVSSQAAAGAHLIADVVDLAMLPSQHFHRIESGDQLSRLPPARTLGALCEWNRLLAADGELRIAVPDLVALGPQLQGLDDLTGEDATVLLERLYGSAANSGPRLTGFSLSRLGAALESSGFALSETQASDGLLRVARKARNATDGPHAYLRSISDPQEFVSEAYLILLGRLADSEGLAHYRAALDSQALSRTEFIAALVGCEEYQQRTRLRRNLDPGSAHS